MSIGCDAAGTQQYAHSLTKDCKVARNEVLPSDMRRNNISIERDRNKGTFHNAPPVTSSNFSSFLKICSPTQINCVESR
jgi:hypothetical protein